MILIGMFDSPYVRRVAIAMTLLGLEFEHRNWSVGKDFDRIRDYSPIGRVPALVLDSGEVLAESALILDYLDSLAGPQRALLPTEGGARRQSLRLIGLATGAVDKGITMVMERVFRPEEKRHAPWTDRCRAQAEGALAELEKHCAQRNGQWLVGDAMTLADITLGCNGTYLREAVPLDLSPYPHVEAHVDRCEALPVFERFHVPFDAPTPAPPP
ncbi:glutathione S-transferase family protein [Pseudoxanthomonas sacheonensis]|uniref:glutathione S-transferase family protein n=1 Tax=Pseudoxanthomonas sacheonensis TaxID=443615 RepID=UPI0013D393EF|nr:glutathione S-transferase family protein [Pseudoxanthomonas sacheonensis]KAF1710200.1 glutathione S-transferase [Pseudoxanthomonas sacheonensis]